MLANPVSPNPNPEPAPAVWCVSKFGHHYGQDEMSTALFIVATTSAVPAPADSHVEEVES
jgi:hypothetical protein